MVGDGAGEQAAGMSIGSISSLGILIIIKSCTPIQLFYAQIYLQKMFII